MYRTMALMMARTRNIISRVLFCLVLLCLGGQVNAETRVPSEQTAPERRDDEVTRVMQEADAAYQQGNYLHAGQLLQQALNIVGDLQQAQLMALFPAPLDGWIEVTEDSESAGSLEKALNILGGGGMLKRYQAQQNADQSVQLALLNNPPRMLNMLLDSMQVASFGKTEKDSITIHHYKSTLHCNPKQECHVVLHLDNHMIFIAHSTQVTGDVLLDYVRGFNFEVLHAR